MKHINEIDLKKELSDSDLIRILNFCEQEFGYGGQYEFNNKNGLSEIIVNYNIDHQTTIDLLYKNKNIRNNDDFIYYDGFGNIKTENRKNEINTYIDIIMHNISNGELKELLEECLNEQIIFN